MRARRPAHRRLRAAPILEQRFGAQDSIDRGLGAEIAAGIREVRDDLMRRQVAICGRRHDREDCAPLEGRERVRGPMMRAVSRVFRVLLRAPAFHSAHAEPHRPTGGTTPRARLDGGLNERPNHRARLGSVVSSASPQISRTFFFSTRSAAVSAKAASFRRSSRSSS